jgi:hypothetical protein
MYKAYQYCMYNIYKASVSPGSLQQIMPYFGSFRYHGSLRHLNGRTKVYVKKNVIFSLEGSLHKN